MTDDVLELFGRIEGIVVLRSKDSAFLVTGIHAQGTGGGEENFVLTCLDVETRKKKRIRMTAKGVMKAFVTMIGAEQETGLKQLLLMDVEKGEWRCYQIDEQLKQELPGLREILSKIEKRDYVV
jgi:hypothetical protein